MTESIIIHEAVEIVENSSALALGGMTLYRRPVTFIQTLLGRANRPRDLTLIAFTAGYESDLLVGAGCVSTVRTVYFGLESFGLAPMFTQKANAGEITIMEETEASIVLGLRASMAGVGFMPSLAWVDTDLPGLRPDVKSVLDPYTGANLIAFPAISIDVAVLHGLEADREGNIKLNTNLGIDLELVYVAETVIVTVEKMVDKVEKSTDGVVIPCYDVDYIVHTPNGAWPTSCYPYYPLDGAELLRYIDACNAGDFEAYLRHGYRHTQESGVPAAHTVP